MQLLIDPKKIRTDLNTQIRVDWNEEAVKEYAELMEAGVVFPALLVFFDEPNDLHILADGFHRLAAHMLVRSEEPILVEQRHGTVDDARWASICANQGHGIRRTNADKHNAAKEALLHPNGAEKTNRKIADDLGINEITVRRVRAELVASATLSQIETRTVRRGDQVYEMKTANIGSAQSPQPPVQQYETCNRCRYFEDGICDADGSEKLHWDIACEDFAIRVEEAPLPEIPPPNYANAKEAVPEANRVVHSRPYKNRSLKNCITVHLPPDNPQLFAIELREHWTPEYLKQCIDALKYLLEDDDPS